AREIPGLLAFGVGTLAIYFSESRIASLSIITLGLGLLLCGLAPSILTLSLATVIMSFGFHYFEPTNSSQLLSITSAGDLGKAQGRLRSYESIAGLVGAGLVLLITLALDYRATFCIIGGAVAGIGIYLTIALPSNRSKTEKRKVTINKRYWLYYSLSLSRGCRRHIFTTFALFLLVKNHGLDITSVAILMLANSAVTIFTNRMLGTLSDKIGERTILVSSSMLLVGVFCGYAYVSFLPFLVGLYMIDNILFGSSIALKSYLRKISTPEDLTSCLSFGMTANHITAVIIPIAGGLIWSMVGHEATFIAGAGIVFIDMVLAMFMPRQAALEHATQQ
ncbi:MAG: MFS transporter, partial [candidate division Zixibacteria bacterium]